MSLSDKEASSYVGRPTSVGNMDLGLQLSSGCNVNDAETLQVDLLVKEENLKEEEYGRMISCQDEEEKPFGEFHCNVKSETDNSEYNVTYYETRHTEVKEEEEQEVELKAELDEQENDDQLECSSETFQAPVEIEVKKEEEEHLLENAPAEAEDDTEGDLLAEDETPPRTRQKKESKKKLVNKERRMKGKSYTGVSENPHVTQQKIHGQNDELNLQLQEGLHHCTVCKKSFTAITELEKHQQILTCSIKQDQSIGNKTHKCVHCGKAFAMAAYLQCHILTHTGKELHGRETPRTSSDRNKPHTCEYCGKRFERISVLKTHMIVHTGEKPHKCVQCGKAFSQIQNLKCHMLAHTGEKPYKCAQCGKASRSSSDLKKHMLVHTGEKPHKCPQCGRGFQQVANLRSHMLIHTGEKPHKCSQCGEAFRYPLKLNQHIRARH
ncbi:zinc finger protein 726-like isoform X1 [Alosa alosa]|uniref:zinc finger protein 726-like isoform X1 n=2 Tax=Alosa alosa TaxID=278164 RepID=UPI00201530E7|nr:zinc finger protein 726-like isoform X1 [Alosa alosa]